MQIDFTGNRALVTGAASPLARGIVDALRAAGATVAAYSPGPGFTRDDAVAAVAGAVRELGGIDILINAVDSRQDYAIDTVTPEIWEQSQVSAKAAFFITQQAIAELKANQGRIVNVSSTLGLMAGEGSVSLEAAASGTVIQLTRMGALTWGAEGVRTNSVCVGSFVDRDGTLHSIGFDETIALCRPATIDDVVGPVLFLASAMIGHTNGAILVTDGGVFAGH